MIENMFRGNMDTVKFAHAVRLLRFYQGLRASGLNIRNGKYDEYRYRTDKKGGYVSLMIGVDLYVQIGLYGVTETKLEVELTTKLTQDLLSLHDVGKGWKLFYHYDADSRHPMIESVACKYSFAKGRSEIEMSTMQVRGFLREVSRLTHPHVEESQPAHP
jgi:hypothetical protein